MVTVSAIYASFVSFFLRMYDLVRNNSLSLSLSLTLNDKTYMPKSREECKKNSKSSPINPNPKSN